MGFNAGTMGALALGLTGASAASGFVGSVSGARNQRASLESQARIAEINAGLAETNAKWLEGAADDATRQGEAQLAASRRKAAGLKGSQRAAMAANGVDLTSDTALDVVTSTDVLAAEDEQAIRENAVRTAWGYRMEAQNARAAGGQQQMAANSARGSARGISPAQAGYTSLLSGASAVADSWYRQQRGVSLRGG